MLDDIAAPDTDQQEHRGQLDLPEEEEEQQIERQEDAHHPRLQDQQQGYIILDARLLPAADNRQQRQQRVQEHHRQAQAINAQEVIDIELDRARFRLNPGNVNRIGQLAQAAKANRAGSYQIGHI